MKQLGGARLQVCSAPQNSKMTRYLVFISISILFFNGEATQAQDPRAAIDAYASGNYFEAIKQYEKLLAKEPNNPDYNIKMGLSYLNTHIDPKRALDYFLTAEQSGEMPSDNLLDLAVAYSYHLQYDIALETVKKYESAHKVKKKNQAHIDRLKSNYIATIDLLKYPVDVSFKNLGPEINSAYADYHPFVTKDEQSLVFTSRRKVKPGSKTEFDGYFASDIFSSVVEGDAWKNASRLGDRINTEYDEQCVGLTDSGDTLFFYVDHIDKFGDIFISTRVMGGYSNAKSLDNIVNSGAIESSCSISNDGNTIIFSSNRTGGQGEFDIWMVKKQPNGTWGAPENLGPKVNSPFNEEFPTLSGDGKTLFFCSDGHPGMGGYDLYFSTWDEQNSVWTQPQNMGYPINTPANEKTISFRRDGKQAYITSLRDEGLGDLDIYKVTYLHDSKDDPALFLLNVTNEMDEAVREKGPIQIKNEFDELIGEYFANKTTDRFVIALYPGKYFIHLDAKGYKPFSDVLVVNNTHTKQDQNLRIIKLQK